MPLEWGDSDAKEIKDAERVQLRSFSTSSHKVDTLVSYRLVHFTNTSMVMLMYFEIGRLMNMFEDYDH